MPSTAATTTGMYSGLQPAITALMATFSAVIETERWVMKPISSLASRPAAASMASTRSTVGGTTGSPSLHPCWKQNSTGSTVSGTWTRLDVSWVGMSVLLDGDIIPSDAPRVQTSARAGELGPERGEPVERGRGQRALGDRGGRVLQVLERRVAEQH